ncbi:MAG: FAD binding domain-containing protein [Burkholderiales bacterium]
MGERRTALVVGGSLGGLFAANLLARAGWDVEVFERAGVALAGRGAGIITHDELFDAMRRAGAMIDATIGCATQGRVTLDRAGHVLAELPMVQILAAWGSLYGLMKGVFPADRYHFNKSLVHVEQNATTVTAHFEDGSQASGDLLVGADGIRSTVRAQFLPQARPVYSGYLAWRGLADERAVNDETRRTLAGRMAFCLPPGEQMLTYLVAARDNSTRAGERRINFVWYRPADANTELSDLCTDAGGRHYAHNIPPDRIRPHVITDMHAAAARLLAPQFVDVVRTTAKPLFQPIYDLESAQLVFGRVALLGDAAFVARPHVGLGVTKAAGDAVALAAALLAHPHDIDSALMQYADRRLEFGKAIVAHARLLGEGIGAPVASSARAAYFRRPGVLMREVAVPDWAERAIALRRLKVA